MEAEPRDQPAATEDEHGGHGVRQAPQPSGRAASPGCRMELGGERGRGQCAADAASRRSLLQPGSIVRTPAEAGPLSLDSARHAWFLLTVAGRVA